MSQYKNSNGSQRITCCNGNALEHWENNSGKKAKQCAVFRCTEKATHGGHVINCHGNAAKTQFIIPLCPKHNHTTFKECFDINSVISPIPVSKSNKCK